MQIKTRFCLNLLLFTLLLIFTRAAYATPTKLINFDISTENNKTRITLNLNSATTYKVFTLKAPDRIIIDLPNTELATTLPSSSSMLITRIREGHPKPNTLRIVLDVTQPQNPNTTILKGKPNAAEQLAIELINPDEKSATPVAQNQQPTDLKQDIQQQITTEIETENLPPEAPATTQQQEVVHNEPPPSETPKLTATPRNTQKTFVVVIDPGHGGKDPGTSGPMGTREKDVVLAISKALQEEINQQPGFRAVLTRDSDYFIPLRKRLSIARENKADMFVAVHADAFINPYANGASVFALSARGASSEAARWLAEKENYSELGGVSLGDKSNILRSVLLDLSQTATISSSLQIGNSVMRQLSKIGRLHRGFVEQAPFVVLKSPDIPSLLVETGFLSNHFEEQRLRDPVYQKKIAIAIASGIKGHFLNS